MRKLVVLLVLLGLVMAATPAFADVPGPGGPYTSGFTIQNLEGVGATCVFDLYDSTGADKYTSTNLSIAANGSYFVYVGGLAINSGQYSAVISCDRQVAAVTNTTGASSADSYNGMGASDIGSPLYVPGVYKNYHGYTSNVVVQNTTGNPVNVTLNIYQSGNSTPVKSYTMNNVPANTSVAFDQSAEADLPDGIYSGQVSSTGAVAAVANLWLGTSQLTSYRAFVAGGAQAYAPVLMNNYYGFNTLLTIQNVGSSTVPVTVTYSNNVVKNLNIAGNSSQALYTPNDQGTTTGIFSAKVVATGGSVVALVNEATSATLNRAGSYPAFAAGGKAANAPIVLKKYHGFTTSITCQNIGGAAANITATFSNGGTQTINAVAINGTAVFFQGTLPDATLPLSFNGSAKMTSAENIVCVVNENQVENTAAQDWLLVYDAVPQ